MALANYDHVMIEVHFGWLNYTPQKAVAMIALLHNAGFQPFWRHFNPWSLARGNTKNLLGHVRDIYGENVANQYEASESNFARLGREFGTFKEEKKGMWKHHVRDGHMLCCWELAFWRADN